MGIEWVSLYTEVPSFQEVGIEGVPLYTLSKLTSKAYKLESITHL